MLHTVNKSPFEKSSLDTSLRLSTVGSAILLIEDAVYGAMTGTSIEDKLRETLENRSVYVLGPDLKARGLVPENVIEGIKVVDYAGFVDLVVEHDKVQSWF